MSDRLKLELQLSKTRQRLGELAAINEPTAEQTAELTRLQGELPGLEQRWQAAVQAEPPEETRVLGDMTPEQRERVELRSRASLGNYLMAAAQGRAPSGAEHELAAAAEVSSGGIPIELWDVREPEETRAITPAPSTVGVNLDTIRPAVFARSIAPMLGIEMPRVMSGTYASATITTSQTAEAKAKSAAIAATAGALTVTTATPKRVSARLELTLEDIAAVGQQNFESILRQNLSLALSAELDNQAINGNGTAPNLTGMFQRLTAPSDPGSIADFDAFAAAHAGGVDGLWAQTIADVSIVVGTATYVLASSTFQSATNYKGELSASAYAMANTGGFWTNSRMPAADSTIQQAILYRKGRMMEGGSGAMRTAVCPHWGEIGVDDIYSGAAKGQRFFTLSVLLGDVIVVQPAAYSQIAFKVA